MNAAYTGGAHAIPANGLLWDRQRPRKSKPPIFAEPANMDRLLTQRWCDALNKAREEKRGEPVGGGGMFDECPKLSEIAIVPTDKDKNGRFERLVLTASPYVAGPYVEGSYEIDLAVTPDMIAAQADYPTFRGCQRSKTEAGDRPEHSAAAARHVENSRRPEEAEQAARGVFPTREVTPGVARCNKANAGGLLIAGPAGELGEGWRRNRKPS